MNMTLNEIKMCLGTLGSVLMMIKKMENPSVKKLRTMIECEIKSIEEQIKIKEQ